MRSSSITSPTARSARRPGHPIADKAYALNKALHALDAFYEVELPDVFAVQHPVGTVLGRATYSDYFICYHNCTVGANLDNDYPVVRPRHRDVWRQPRDRKDRRSATTASCRPARSSSTAARCEPDSVLHGIYPNARRSRTERNVVRDIFGVSDRDQVSRLNPECATGPRSNCLTAFWSTAIRRSRNTSFTASR